MVIRNNCPAYLRSVAGQSLRYLQRTRTFGFNLSLKNSNAESLADLNDAPKTTCESLAQGLLFHTL